MRKISGSRVEGRGSSQPRLSEVGVGSGGVPLFVWWALVRY